MGNNPNATVAAATDLQLEAPTALADDTLYRALAARPRRHVLYYLLDNAEATVDQLADVLSGWEAAREGTVATLDTHEKHRVVLRHHHLPMLAAADLIRYDDETGNVVIEHVDPIVRDLVRQSIAAERSD